MTPEQSLVTFTVAAVLLALTPGIDTALVLRMTITSGMRKGLSAAVGIAIGCLLWGAIVSSGLGALLATSEMLFNAVKLTGAVYLFWQGFMLLKSKGLRSDSMLQSSNEETTRSAFFMGFLTNALNPKVGIFYLTLLPQFVPIDVNVAVFSFALACIHVVVSLIWFALLIGLSQQATIWLQKPHIITKLDKMTGVIFLGFGFKLALSSTK